MQIAATKAQSQITSKVNRHALCESMMSFSDQMTTSPQACAIPARVVVVVVVVVVGSNRAARSVESQGHTRGRDCVASDKQVHGNTAIE